MQEIQCKISGLVQGVFFRVYAKEHADNLKIVGYVKNLDDGTVDVTAQSNNEDFLKYFISKLKEGSALAKVDRVDTVWVSPEDDFDHFLIKYE